MKTPNLKTCPKWQRVLSRSEREHLWQDVFPTMGRLSLAEFKDMRQAQAEEAQERGTAELCFECRMIARALGLEQPRDRITGVNQQLKP